MNSPRLDWLYSLWHDFNEELFDGLLTPIRILIKKNRTKDGWYEYTTEKRDGHPWEAWYPRRDMLHNATITISDGCFDEGTVEGTLIHEMMHQWQAEIDDDPSHHDAQFRAWARALEAETGFDIE